jgi:preprotein translocase subunit SecY
VANSPEKLTTEIAIRRTGENCRMKCMAFYHLKQNYNSSLYQMLHSSLLLNRGTIKNIFVQKIGIGRVPFNFDLIQHPRDSDTKICFGFNLFHIFHLHSPFSYLFSYFSKNSKQLILYVGTSCIFLVYVYLNLLPKRQVNSLDLQEPKFI